MSHTLALAQEIRRQIPLGVLWSLGATELAVMNETEEQMGGLAFEARILPMLKSGRRGTRARKMTVTIALSYADYYDIRVYYWNKFDLVEHFSISDIDFTQLPNVLLALDYDGEGVLNPRYFVA